MRAVARTGRFLVVPYYSIEDLVPSSLRFPLLSLLVLYGLLCVYLDIYTHIYTHRRRRRLGEHLHPPSAYRLSSSWKLGHLRYGLLLHRGRAVQQPAMVHHWHDQRPGCAVNPRRRSQTVCAIPDGAATVSGRHRHHHRSGEFELQPPRSLPLGAQTLILTPVLAL